MRALADFNIELWLRNVEIDTYLDSENMKKGIIQALTDELNKMDLSEMIREYDEADRRITDIDFEILEVSYYIEISNIEYAEEDAGKDLPKETKVSLTFLSKYAGPFTGELEITDEMREEIADELQFKFDLEEVPVSFDCKIVDFE